MSWAFVNSCLPLHFMHFLPILVILHTYHNDTSCPFKDFPLICHTTTWEKRR